MSARARRQKRTSANTGNSDTPQRWVFLADPKDYGFDELLEERSTVWGGIRNATAQQNLRRCHDGDLVLLYHTSPDRALVATARVAGEPLADPDDAKRSAVRLEPITRLARSLPLREVKEDDVLASTAFARMPRVAVHPITEEEWDRVLALTGTDPGEAIGMDPAGAGAP